MPKRSEINQYRKIANNPATVVPGNVRVAGKRKTVLSQSTAIRAYQFLRATGADDRQLAAFFEVAPDTIKDWMKSPKVPEFRRMVQLGRWEYDSSTVVTAIKQRALGYDYEEIREKEGPSGYERTVVKKHIPADVQAAIFWLTNRDPEHWQNTQNTTMTHKVFKQSEVDKKDLSVEEAARMYDAVAQGAVIEIDADTGDVEVIEEEPDGSEVP